MEIDWKLLLMLLLDFLIFSFYSMPLPFYPKIAQDYGLTKAEIGLVFGTFALGSFFCSILFGKLMSVVGKHKLLYICTIIASLSTFSFGFLEHLDKTQTNAFFGLSLLIRFVSGFVSGGVVTIICGFLPIMYKQEQIAQKFAYFEIAFSASSIGGSSLGALLYQYIGFQWPFIILASCYLIVGIPCIYSIPMVDIVESGSKVENNEESVASDLPKPGYQKLFTNGRFVMTSVITGTLIIVQSFLFTTLQVHMEEYANGDKYVLACFVSGSLVYLISIVTYSETLPLRNNCKRIYMFMGSFMSICSLLIAGPITAFGIPNNMWLAFFGLIVQQVTMSLSFFPLLNELNEISLGIYSQQPECKNQVTDMTSGIFSASMSLGDFLGPFITGIIYDSCSFSKTTLIVFIFAITMLVLYMTVGKGFEIFTQTFQNESEQKNSVLKVENKNSVNIRIQNQAVGWYTNSQLKNQKSYLALIGQNNNASLLDHPEKIIETDSAMDIDSRRNN